jgi:hypothetical protein
MKLIKINILDGVPYGPSEYFFFFVGGGGGGFLCLFNGTAHLKNVNKYLNLPLETSVGQSSYLNLNVVHLTPVLIRHLWYLKTVVFLHWCLILVVLFIISVKIPH